MTTQPGWESIDRLADDFADYLMGLWEDLAEDTEEPIPAGMVEASPNHQTAMMQEES